MGNTVIVVEHDEETMRCADLIVDFGPGPGVRGGEVVAMGSADELCRNARSLTGKYLSGAEEIPIPSQRRPVSSPPAVKRRVKKGSSKKAKGGRSPRLKRRPRR